MSTLHLTLKKQWFDMILSGGKREEYREIKPYWERRLCREFDPTTKRAVVIDGRNSFKKFNTVTFSNGYSNDSRKMIIGIECIEIGYGVSEWGAPPYHRVFIIKLGNIIERKNIKL